MTLTIELPQSLVTSLRNLPEEAQSERLEPVVRAAVQAALQAAQQAEENAEIEAADAALSGAGRGVLAPAEQSNPSAHRLREIIQAARQAT